MIKNNILVVGSGAREHAIVRALNRSNHEKEIFCIASNFNPGISELIDELIVSDINSPEVIVNYAKEKNITLCIVGPENPLSNGVANALLSKGVKVVGPKKELAMLETSKAFTRDLLVEYKIPGAPIYSRFKNLRGVSDLLKKLGENYVVKDDGLAGGKGVKVSGEHLYSHREAIDYCRFLIEQKKEFIIEEKFTGEEFSLMSFCDGTTLKHMPAIQDHKRAYDGDLGPNTGGMGTYSDCNHSLPFLNKEDLQEAKNINKATSIAIKNKCGEGFKGVLYGGFMATESGVKLIEYNARFGDPEAMNVLSLLKSDFIDICIAIADETLKDIDVSFQKKATVCKYAVPDGYPDSPIKGQRIDVSNIKNADNLFFASVDYKDGGLVEAGSRTVAVVGISNSISEAEKIAEAEISCIEGPLFHRSDIGKKDVVQKKIDHMRSLR
jgi:phosphoribosylamine--glycine ligase